MHSVYWPTAKFKRRRPGWRKRPRSAGMVSDQAIRTWRAAFGKSRQRFERRYRESIPDRPNYESWLKRVSCDWLSRTMPSRLHESIDCTAERPLRGYSSPSGVPSVDRGSCGRTWCRWFLPFFSSTAWFLACGRTRSGNCKRWQADWRAADTDRRSEKRPEDCCPSGLLTERAAHWVYPPNQPIEPCQRTYVAGLMANASQQDAFSMRT